MSQASPHTPAISQTLTLVMAVATGVAVASIYYHQPMLGIMQRDLGSPVISGLIPTVTQLGYAAGLFLLVPLGDLRDRRRLIVTQFLLLALSVVLMAIAPTAGVVALASLAMGACATVAQQIVPFAATLASPASRGKTVGTVMAGLLCGILLSRTLAGFVATHWGWREMFWLAAPLAVLMAGLMAWLLPRNYPRLTMKYGAALASLISLWRNERALRHATLIQAAQFASFSAFWTILALHLQEPAYHLGADVAGMFGVIGAVGVIAAPIAGRIADRRGPDLVIAGAALLSLVAWLIFGLWGSLAGLITGVIILDFGVQSSLISNQHVVYALHPEARSRLNTVFMIGMFLGGASGSAGATLAWNLAGWPALCALGVVLSLIALGVVTVDHRSKKN